MRRIKKVSRNQYYLHRMIRLGMQMFGFGKKKPKMVLKVEKREDTKENKK